MQVLILYQKRERSDDVMYMYRPKHYKYLSVVILRRLLRALLKSVDVIFKRTGHIARLEGISICS